jgi:hypothetical protein
VEYGGTSAGDLLEDDGPWRDAKWLGAAGLMPSNGVILEPANSLHLQMAAAMVRPAAPGSLAGLQPSMMVAAEPDAAGDMGVWHSLPQVPSARPPLHTAPHRPAAKVTAQRSASAPTPASTSSSSGCASKLPVRPSPFANPKQHLATLSAIHGKHAPPPAEAAAAAAQDLADMRPPSLARLRIRKGEAPPPVAAAAHAHGHARGHGHSHLHTGPHDSVHPMSSAGGSFTSCLSYAASGNAADALAQPAEAGSGSQPAASPTRRGAADAWQEGARDAEAVLNEALSTYLTPHGSLAPPPQATPPQMTLPQHLRGAAGKGGKGEAGGMARVEVRFSGADSVTPRGPPAGLLCGLFPPVGSRGARVAPGGEVGAAAARRQRRASKVAAHSARMVQWLKQRISTHGSGGSSARSVNA